MKLLFITVLVFFLLGVFYWCTWITTRYNQKLNNLKEKEDEMKDKINEIDSIIKRKEIEKKKRIIVEQHKNDNR